MKSIVSEKGQVTIPKRLRDRLGIRPGQVLDFEEDSGRLVARKRLDHDPIEALFGTLDAGGKTTDEIIEELRGKPDAIDTP
jgi:AbrB family looped-hinge helix DNA binding protein